MAGPAARPFEPKVVDAFRFDEVAPHPRYPLESSCPSDGVSARPAAATNVGSLLGLNPYSAISLLRSSSVCFFAFRLLHKKNPIKKAAAMTTMGMMTAIAIFAPEDKPPEDPDPEPEALRADGVELEVDEVAVVALVAVSEVVSVLNVDVTTTTEGVGVVEAIGVVEGVCVIVAVTSTTLGVVEGGATYVVEGAIEVTEVMVVGGREVVSEVVLDDSVTVTVVEKEVVKLVDVVPIVVVTTESVAIVLVSVDIVSRG